MVDVHAHLDTIRRVTVTSVVGFIALFIAQSSYPPTFTPEYHVVTAVAAMFATDMILETFFPYQRIRSQTPPRSTVSLSSQHASRVLTMYFLGCRGHRTTPPRRHSRPNRPSQLNVLECRTCEDKDRAENYMSTSSANPIIRIYPWRTVC